jgi:two-component system, NarL family, sensor histidine kinase DesK
MNLRLLPEHLHIGRAPYAFLLYLAFVFIAPVIRKTPADWAIALGSLAVFLPMYFRNFWVQGAEAVLMCTGMALVGFVVFPYNWGATAYMIFAAAGFAFALRPSRAVIALAILSVLITFETLWFGLPPWAWMPGVIGCIAVGGSNIYEAERFRHGVQLRRAEEQIEQMAKVAERERIARDLHDLLGHTLSVIVMKSELASKLADRDFTRAIQEIRDVERVSRETLTEVRRAVEGYRKRGLGGELASAATTLRSAGVTFETDVAPVALPPRQETALALVLREAVTNVVRHAKATRCRVSLSAEGSRLVFTIHDNGRGGTPREGNGLHGMRTRIAEAGGTLSVDGSDGMRVVITLPVSSPATALAS